MRLVTKIDDEKIAKLLADPMRRAILNILRERPMTGSQLAQRLGLTDATVNHHMNILRRAKLVVLAKKEREEHGIMQKFYLPSSYLYLPDVENLKPEVAKYYLPINIERIRGALSTFRSRGQPAVELSGAQVDSLGEELAKMLVRVARRYESQDVEPGAGESLVNSIYFDSFARLPSSPKGRAVS